MKVFKNCVTSHLLIATPFLMALLAFTAGCAKKEVEEIKIGAVLPLTGESAIWGTASKNGIDLAIREINNSGGIHGDTISAIYEDDQGDTKTAISSMNKLVYADQVSVVIGTLFSTSTLAVAPIAEKNKVILLSPAATAPSIIDAGDFIFRNCASDILEGNALAKFAYDELDLDSVAIFYINNDYGLGLQNAFKNMFESLGGTILAIESFEQSSTDFRSQISKIKATVPDAVFIPGYPAEMARLLVQAKELGINTQFLSIVVFEDPRILTIAGDAAEGTIFSSRAYDPQSADPQVLNFVANYTTTFGAPPDIYAALSYDALKLLAKAIEDGGTSSEDIKKALYKIQDYQGVTGTTTFDKYGDVTKPIKMKILKDGSFQWINEG